MSMAELDLFSAPMKHQSIDEKLYIEVLPLSAITNGGLIKFFIARDREKYLDLNDTLLHLLVRITKADSMNLDDDAPVGLINDPLNTMN